MELLLILIYVSICYVVFKVFKIPVNQWSLATATLGGIIGIVLLLLIMNYNHPFTKNARIYFSVTPVLPGVRGRVVDAQCSTRSRPVRSRRVEPWSISPSVPKAAERSRSSILKRISRSKRI